MGVSVRRHGSKGSSRRLFEDLGISAAGASPKRGHVGRSESGFRRLPSPDGDCRLLLAGDEIRWLDGSFEAAGAQFLNLIVARQVPIGTPCPEIAWPSRSRRGGRPCRTTPPNNPLNLTDPLPSLDRAPPRTCLGVKRAWRRGFPNLASTLMLSSDRRRRAPQVMGVSVRRHGSRVSFRRVLGPLSIPVEESSRKRFRVGRAETQSRRLPSPDGDCRLLLAGGEVRWLDVSSDAAQPQFLNLSVARQDSIETLFPGFPWPSRFRRGGRPCRTTPPNNPLNLTDPLPILDRDPPRTCLGIKRARRARLS